jgi:hypothetical protein
MKHSFLICSLPRSRTLWFSKFLTVPGVSVCTHEATEFASSPAEFWDNAEHFCSDSGVEIYGNSDSANLFVLPSILAARPLTKVIWIQRPIDDVWRSMKEAGIPCDISSSRLLETLRHQHRECFDLVVDYHSLSSRHVCEQIWNLVLPSIPFDLARWIEYADKRICYSKQNPVPQKDFRKFLDWVQAELSQPVHGG